LLTPIELGFFFVQSAAIKKKTRLNSYFVLLKDLKQNRPIYSNIDSIPVALIAIQSEI
jgi:hypothetical protein